jgi:hypothetical protein
MRRPSKKSLKNIGTFEMAVEEPIADPRPESEVAGANVFDKLSKTLGGLAANLGEEEAASERSLRETLVESLKHYAGDKLTTGQLLRDYKAVYKTKRQWTSVAEEIGAAIQCSARTIFRLVDDFEASLAPTPSPNTVVDRAEIIGPKLSKEEKLERNARLAIRVFLNNFPESERLKKLADLLSEEAHQVWGKRDPFKIEIEVTPRPSSLTIDGRKKLLVMPAEEKAA